jgi:sirohydrochlorin ferrochelatase
MPHKKPGLLLVGHGTRNQRGLAEFRALVLLIAQSASDFEIESCFLELAQPDIPTAVGKLLAREIESIVVSPVLLFAAGHAKRDIPQAVEEALRAHRSEFGVQRVMRNEEWGMGNAESASQISHQAATVVRAESPSTSKFPSSVNTTTRPIVIAYAAPLECHEQIVELSAQRFDEGIAAAAHRTSANGPTNSPAEAASTFLLLVGRGSSEPTAVAEMERFTQLRTQRTAVACSQCCFVAKAEPTLAAGLEMAAKSDCRRIVVQPHLLFVGQVLDEIAAGVQSQAIQCPEKQWIVAEHLGPSPLVAQTVVSLARQASATMSLR